MKLAARLDPQHANDNDAFVPEIWAQEGLAILEENMVAANLVHRDFENEIARFGDVVNTVGSMADNSSSKMPAPRTSAFRWTSGFRTWSRSMMVKEASPSRSWSRSICVRRCKPPLVV